jgi:hypothetical protein
MHEHAQEGEVSVQDMVRWAGVDGRGNGMMSAMMPQHGGVLDVFMHDHRSLMLGNVHWVQEDTSDDLRLDGLVQNMLDIRMYGVGRLVHAKCSMKWPKEL